MTLFQRRSAVMTSDRLRRMVISAMFLALALIIRTLFRTYIPLFGESGLRISVHGIFSVMPAILFGPVYGAIVSGLTDFIGFHLSPTGAFIPQLTLTAALGGFVRGALWMFLRKGSTTVMRIVVLALSIVFIGVGGGNMAALSADGVNRDFYEAYTDGTIENAAGQTVPHVDRESIDTTGMFWISRMAVTRSINANNPANVLDEFLTLMTVTTFGAGAFGLLLVLMDWMANKFLIKDKASMQTMPLLLALMIPAVLISTINTEILRHTAFPSWQLLPFSVVWLPRVMQTMATTTLITYFVAMLLGVCKNQPHLREWIKLK